MTVRRQIFWLLLAGTLIAAHALDYVSFVFAVGILGIPLSWEVNPLMVGSWLIGGPLGVLALECAFVALILALMARVKTKSIWPPYYIGAGFGLIGCAANLSAIHSWLGL